MGDNFIQEAVGMGSVHLINVRVGECEVRGVLHEVLHVPSLVKIFFQLVRLLFKSSRQNFNRKNVSSKIMFEKFLQN